MNPKDILLLGVKGSVVAFNKTTGVQLWATHLKSVHFVTVTADDTRVYAHTNGELFCLDLQTGSGIWQNELPGFGYNTASLALPGLPVSADAVLEKKRQEEAAAHTVVHTA